MPSDIRRSRTRSGRTALPCPALAAPWRGRGRWARMQTFVSILVTGICVGGCGGDPDSAREPIATVDSSAGAASEQAAETMQPRSYEATAEQLLAARLPDDELAEGWVRLFDGHTLFGWEITGDASFRIEDKAIVVDSGTQCLLCTSTTWGDFELTLQFRADRQTNSGIFVRTPLQPENPETDCYEINIAPPEHPFPTGSIVGRKKADPPADSGQADSETAGDLWRELKIAAAGDEVSVTLDGSTVCQYTDPLPLAARRIGLQHNSGPVRFRDIKIRPLGLEPMLDEDLTQWKRYPEMPGSFEVNERGELHVQGGRSQLETQQSYGDFLMLAQYKIDDPAMNSGIFFRCIPGDVMMGYECQINNGFLDGSRLKPADCGTGGIFRRQDARLVAGEDGEWSTVLLHASGPTLAAWVEGIPVSNWTDTREPDANPRRGKRTEPGTIMIQGHDPGTDVLFRDLKIAPLR